MTSQQPQHSSSVSHHRRSRSDQQTASREAFLWRRKLEMEEQAFDTIARINALQDKLTMIEEQKKQFKHALTKLQETLRKDELFQRIPLVAILARKPQPDLRLLETQIKRLVEEEGKTKADLSLAQHLLDSLNAKVAHLEFEQSLL